jgi:glyoxylate carboligase
MYRLARKSTKIFNSYITSFEGFNVPGFGVVRFFHPISTASFTDNAIEMLKKTYVGRVIASILENLNNIDYYHHIDSIVDGNLIDNTTTKFFF